MKVKDILKLIEDKKQYIEFIDNNYVSYGIYTKNDLIYNDKFNNNKIVKISTQYIDDKRLLVLYI